VALSLDFSTEVQFSKGLTFLQDLHDLQDRVLPLASRLRSTLTTIVSLKEMNQLFRKKEVLEVHQLDQMANELRSYETRVKGHLASVELLEKRVQEILKLVSRALGILFSYRIVEIERRSVAIAG
jgi:hypothetical protein